MLNSLRHLQLWLRRRRNASLAARIRTDKSTRKTFLNYLSERRCQIVLDNDDHRVIINPMDSVIGERILQLGHWHRDQFLTIIKALQAANALPSGRTFVDVGANIGTQTIYALKSGVFRDALAIEPEPDNFRLLSENIAINDLSSVVRLANVAAGARHARLPLTVRRKNHGGHAINQPLEPGDRRVDVDVVPLADVLREQSVSDIGMLWIDCEGHEPQALAGAWSAVPDGTPICLEFTPERYGIEGTRSFVADLVSRYDRYFLVSPNGEICEQKTTELDNIRERVDVVLFARQYALAKAHT